MSNWKETGLPCPQCDSSDAYSITHDGWGKCFSCNSNIKIGEETTTVHKERPEPTVLNELPQGNYTSIPDRGISEKTCRVLGIETGSVNGKITAHLYKYFAKEDSTKPVLAKKRVVEGKQFGTMDTRPTSKDKDGRWHREGSVGLFGWQAFEPTANSSVTITEGELDAAAVYEMNHGFPVVSVRSSASALADCKEFREYLDGFKKIVIAFDADEAGRKASKQVSDLFPNKAHIMALRHGNDPCDYLMAGKSKEFNKEWYEAKKIGIEGIKFGREDWTALSKSKPKQGLPICWPTLQEATFGIRKGEVWTLGGGTGLGKSEAYKEIAYGLVKDHGVKVGMIFLEEGDDRTAQCMIGKELGYRYFLEGSEAPIPEAMEAAVELLSEHVAISHGIDQTWEAVERTAKTMKQSLGCDYLFVDHVTAIAEGKGADVNSTLHMIYEKLNTLAVQLDVAFLTVSHLNQAGNKNYTEGAHVSLRDFYGSGAIMQRSNFVLGFEGDIRGEKIPKDHRRLVVLKDRNRGDAAGTSLTLRYHKHLNNDDLDGRLLECTVEQEHETVGEDT